MGIKDKLIDIFSLEDNTQCVVCLKFFRVPESKWYSSKWMAHRNIYGQACDPCFKAKLIKSNKKK